jgi:hypothetical protein
MPTSKTPMRPAPASRRPAPAASPKAAAPAAQQRRKASAAPAVPVAAPVGMPPPAPAKRTKAPKLRIKPVRDSFTMPQADFSLIGTLKARALAAQRETKKSELLRAGLHALAALDTPALVAALNQLEPVKIGRPKKAG